ncbi:MAG TPA: adenylate/guanylate cyclase domain-containing protein [Candidatus Dormibacteraeota bacterium]|nr:adenylate/guanylate cyclase domain-containing protein [Candidatus Dormibacteraeota bacterium]
MPLSAATDLPTGTVTFLFTDIQGSTKLVQQLGIQRWTALLQDHYEILRQAFAAHNGTEVNTEGDAFFVAFASASDAVAACAAGQRALTAHQWPEDAVIRVRMGVHSGEAAVVGGDYMGFEIHRAARIASTGHGGQVVLSDATRALLQGGLPEGVTLADMGEHRLKDLAQPEHIWQLNIDGLSSEFPPLKSLDYTPNNLPTQLTSFVGRDAELTEGARLLDGARLLTLTGPGGTGKTRLSMQIAADAADRFKHGVWFVALAPVTDSDLVPSAILDALKIQDVGNRKPLDVLLDHLRDKEMLLVLDNFEQILEAAPAVAEILKTAPAVKVVTSSRAPLRVYGEQEFPIPPLSLPDLSAKLTLEAMSQFEAVRLFIERAVSVKPDFQVTNENAPAVAGICTLVDGLPLAIELAAARIRLFTPEVMLKRLETSLADLGGGARDLPARQQTLRGAIEWSYQLLEEGVQTFMARLSVFAGGATIGDIEQVCSPGLDIDVFSGLETLVEHNLLRPDDRGAEPRFFMLHVIREFAMERLRESPEGDEVRQRHAHAYLELGQRAGPELTGGESLKWLERLDIEHDNIRTALTCFRERGEADSALLLMSALWRFWTMRGHVVEAVANVNQVLEMPGSAEHRPEQMLGWEAAGGIAWWAGDIDRCTVAYGKALALARELADDAAIARNLYNSVFPMGALPDVSPSLPVADEAIAKFDALGDDLGGARVRWLKASILVQLNRHQEGYELGVEANEVFRRADSAFDLAWGNHTVGLAALRLNRPDEARAAFVEGANLLLDSGDIAGQTIFLGDFSDLAALQGDAERAVRLRGASAALQQATGSTLEDLMSDSYTTRQDIASMVDEATFRELFDEGARMTREEAVEYALEEPPDQIDTELKPR